MNIRHFSARSHGSVQLQGRSASPPRGFFVVTTDALNAARARLAASHAEYQRLKGPSNAIYYPPERKSPAEQLVDGLQGVSSLDAVVTRNHYGSVVLNAHHALFIDVDMPETDGAPRHTSAYQKQIPSLWQSTFADLCTVLANERGAGFRIYRTAAGFRILATTHEFEPGSDSANELMTLVGADDAFVRLCGVQKTFRARLTPKPWRCGADQPPNQFPRETAEEQCSFAEWLSQYERLLPARYVPVPGKSRSKDNASARGADCRIPRSRNQGVRST